MAEVTMMRASATATTVVVNLYPIEGRDMEVDTNKCQVNTNTTSCLTIESETFWGIPGVSWGLPGDFLEVFVAFTSFA